MKAALGVFPQTIGKMPHGIFDERWVRMTTNSPKTDTAEPKDKPRKFMILVPVGRLPKRPDKSSSE